MNHFYYTMQIYIGSYPSEIIGREMLEIADEISSILGCTYEKLGYSLLHPDYDYKQIGKSFRNGKKGRTKFINLQIPMLYYGEETDSSPMIEFECHMKNKDIFPYFSIELDYTFHSGNYSEPALLNDEIRVTCDRIFDCFVSIVSLFMCRAYVGHDF